MPLFSRKSKAKKAEEAEQQRAALQLKADQKAKRNTIFTKSKSLPSSRRNSIRGDAPSALISHPAYAQTNIIIGGSSSKDQSYLPVPEIPAKLQKDRDSADKAARVLGVDSRTIQSAPSSPKFLPRDRARSEYNSYIRHDSVNSDIEGQKLNAVPQEASKASISFNEELESEPAFSDCGQSDTTFRQSITGAVHERNVSRDSYRPVNTRRHTIHRERQDLNDQRTYTARQPVPSYSMPTKQNRATIHIDAVRQYRQSEAPSATHQPMNRAQMAAYEQLVANSPSMRPQFQAFQDDTASIRSYSAHPPLPRQQSQYSSAAQSPLLILDGLKVNKRGRILDEEGDPIGELVEGDLIDCVRQKVNGYGEVIDEYGRVVGRVRTLLNSIGVSSPALNTSSPAILDNHVVDYFNLQAQSPRLAPAMDAQAMQRRIQDEMRTKYRMTMDIPPVPTMPAAYLDSARSPIQSRYITQTYDYEAAQCAELPADEDDDDHLDAIPGFDLSEPFCPTPALSAGSSVSSQPTSPPESVTAHIIDSMNAEDLKERSQEVMIVPATEEDLPTVTMINQDGEDEDQEEEEEEELTVPEKNAARAVAAPLIRNDKLPHQPAQQPEQKLEHIPALQTAISTLPSQRKIVPVSQLKQAEEPKESNSRPTTAVAIPAEPARPFIVSRAKTAPSRATPKIIAATAPSPPSMPRAQTLPETQPMSASTSGYVSAEESMSDDEPIEVQSVQRKEVRISNLPPTTIPARGLGRSLSDGAGLTRFSAMPSVPESEPLPDTPRKSSLVTTADSAVRPAARPFASKSAPLPSFPRQNFTSNLPPSPFAAANAASPVAKPKRMPAPIRPGVPPPNVQAAMARRNRYTMNAPLVSSPLSDHRKTMSSITTSTISSESSDFTPLESDNGSEKTKSDAISIMSTSSRPRTYFTHAGRVTVEAGDLPPSMQKKDAVEVSTRAVPETFAEKKKRRFSIKLGGKKSNAVAAH